MFNKYSLSSIIPFHRLSKNDLEFWEFQARNNKKIRFYFVPSNLDVKKKFKVKNCKNITVTKPIKSIYGAQNFVLHKTLTKYIYFSGITDRPYFKNIISLLNSNYKIIYGSYKHNNIKLKPFNLSLMNIVLEKNQPQQATIYNTKFLRQIYGFNEKFKIWADLSVNLVSSLILKSNNIKFTKKLISNISIDQDSKSLKEDIYFLKKHNIYKPLKRIFRLTKKINSHV